MITKPRLLYEATSVELEFLPSGDGSSLHVRTAQPEIDITILMDRDQVAQLAAEISARLLRSN